MSWTDLLKLTKQTKGNHEWVPMTKHPYEVKKEPKK